VVAAVVSELNDDVAEMAAAYTASTTSTSGALSDLLEALRPAPRSWSRLITELSLVLQMDDPAHVMLRPMLLMLLFFLPVLLPLLCLSPLPFLLSVAAAGAG
jgi:hypothetical protein